MAMGSLLVIERMMMEETDGDEFVLVPDAVSDDEIAHEPRLLAVGYREKSIHANYFAAAAATRQREVFDNDEVELVANASEGSGAVEDDEAVVVDEQEQESMPSGCSAPWGSRPPPPAWPCWSAAAATAAKVAARRDARLDQGISVARAEHAPAPAPAVISFGGCKT
ncbi:hypothetical protein E2562_008927 [Oryza meyeriana var. granulata]|uniref:Uncharacterized protein n=1 Tax=Oryza meyeriana var. granulata TaxID=110450 RepID=A0A6G1D0H9_9ORYZ|nr:hypothetical protein E2562_008927 [Oryza meyeriana var. granulata]